MDIDLFEEISLTVCITGLCLYMLYIIYKLAVESKAGKFGTFILFAGLGFGIFGFAAKKVIMIFLGM